MAGDNVILQWGWVHQVTPKRTAWFHVAVAAYFGSPKQPKQPCALRAVDVIGFGINPVREVEQSVQVLERLG